MLLKGPQHGMLALALGLTLTVVHNNEFDWLVPMQFPRDAYNCTVPYHFALELLQCYKSTAPHTTRAQSLVPSLADSNN